MKFIEEAWIDWVESLSPDKAAAHDQVQARSLEAFRRGTDAERERLLPLLGLCLAELEYFKGSTNQFRPDLTAALSAALESKAGQ